MHDWVYNYALQYLVMDEQIKSPRDCVDFFLWERYAVQLCHKASGGSWCRGFWFFAPRNDRLKQIDVKTWIMEKRMLDTCTM